MRPHRRRGGLLALAAATCLAAGACGSSSRPAGPPAGAGVAPVPLGLDTSVATAHGTYAAVAMGRLDQPLNTFWELFLLSGPSGRWELRTPPGVADNGGLVVSAAAGSALIGFRGSGDLAFSPLARTTDAGVHYSTGVLPAGLADTPDALSAGTASVAALAGRAVWVGSTGLSGWRRQVTESEVAASAAGRACGLGALTSVTDQPAGLLVAGPCARSGVTGVFRLAGGGVTPAGPRLGGGAVDVVRMVPYERGVALLAEVRSGPSAYYEAAWQGSPGGSWSTSARLPAGVAATSVALTAGGGFAVLGSGTRAPTAAVVDGPREAWRRLPAPPAASATLAVTGSRLDALVVQASKLGDYRLQAGAWVRQATVQVPIVYGSSG